VPIDGERTALDALDRSGLDRRGQVNLHTLCQR
jgi:hypothetical protein